MGVAKLKGEMNEEKREVKEERRGKKKNFWT